MSDEETTLGEGPRGDGAIPRPGQGKIPRQQVIDKLGELLGIERGR